MHNAYAEHKEAFNGRKPKKKSVDAKRAFGYSLDAAGERVATSQVGRGPGPNLFPAAGSHGSQESESKQLHFDSTQLHWLWNETRLRLNQLATRADEGVDVQPAMDFARWIQFSGLIKLFKDNPQSEPVKVDGELIDKLVRDLVMDCGDYLKLNTPGFVRVCQIEAVNHKLDLIAAQLAKVSPPATETATVGTTAPALQVIQGGAE